jgi:hypothetical protein
VSNTEVVPVPIENTFYREHILYMSTTEVVPVPLFQALDGTETSDYVQRVEPSFLGGRSLLPE